MDESLKHIEEQQRALNKALDGYEEIVKQILNNGGRPLDLGPADRERDNRCETTFGYWCLRYPWLRHPGALFGTTISFVPLFLASSALLIRFDMQLWPCHKPQLTIG